MKFFLCGGGSGEKTQNATLLLNEKIDHSKPLLYIPLAMDSSKYNSCYDWIKSELKEVKVAYIDMVRTPEELLNKDLNSYGAIFIGGGNTFKLLSELKRTGMLNRLKDYLEQDGIIFGGSAGANMITLNTEQDKVKFFLSISSEAELMNFLDTNITYGWLDKNKGKHLNNLKNFRQNYKIKTH